MIFRNAHARRFARIAASSTPCGGYRIHVVYNKDNHTCRVLIHKALLQRLIYVELRERQTWAVVRFTRPDRGEGAKRKDDDTEAKRESGERIVGKAKNCFIAPASFGCRKKQKKTRKGRAETEVNELSNAVVGTRSRPAPISGIKAHGVDCFEGMCLEKGRPFQVQSKRFLGTVQRGCQTPITMGLALQNMG